MGELRIPVALAVTVWAASALAVTTYTVIAFKETSTTIEEGIAIGADPLVAEAAIFAANEVGGKPLNRNKFQPSGN